MATAAEARRPVVPMPKWSSIIGCARAVVAILVLAFAAAATGIWGAAPGFGVALFTASATIFVFAYYFVALSHSPALYNRWAVLTLEAVGTFLWLVSLALLSGWSAHHRGGPPKGYGFWNASFRPETIGLQSRPPGGGHRKIGIAFAGTAAGLSGLELALFAITLATFGIALNRQRREEEGRRRAPAATAMAIIVPQTTENKEANKQFTKPASEPVVV